MSKPSRPLRKDRCECDNPLDRTIPKGYGLQCRRCFEANKVALALHDRTRRWQNEEEWIEAMEKKKINRWFKRQWEKR